MSTEPTRRTFLIGLLAAAATACAASTTETSTAPATTGGTTSTSAAPGSTATTATSGTSLAASTSTSTSTTTAPTPSTTAPTTTKTPSPTQPTPTSTTASASATPARFVDHAGSAATQIALTFHTNGDLSLAQQLLDIVTARSTPITCFIVGNWLEQNPGWARKLADGGAEFANHTYTHPDFTTLSPAAMNSEITRCRDVLTRLTGSGGNFFRPSGTNDGTASPGPTILQAAGAAGYATVLGFDLDPYDYQDPGAAAVRQRVKDGLGGGKVVSLHFGHPGTVEALPGILDDIKTAGLTPVTASRLLGR